MTVITADRTQQDQDARIDIVDPHTGDPVGSLACADEHDVAEACRRSEAASPGWARTAPDARGAALHAAANALEECADELTELNTRETGKPLADSHGGVMAGVGTLRQYAELGPLHQGTRLGGAVGNVDYSVPEPRGVVAVVTPWNDPVAIACGLIGAALVTGNTVIHKPSERSPHVGERLGEILAESFPEDALITLTGASQTGQRLVSSPRVAMVAHVGSTSAGESIARAAAQTGAYVIRENGGNDAFIVDSGVDAAWAAQQAALGCFANTGQICTSVERIFVHDDVADAFVEALCEEAVRLNHSDQMGPLVDEWMRTEVHEKVTDAVSHGARVVVGGEIPGGPGSHYPATVMVDCEPDQAIFRDEVFGPVAAVKRVASFDEALALASDDRYGLAATVLTADLGNAERAAAELPVGTVKVNAVFGGAPGGSAEPRGASGSGFGYGPRLLDEMTRLKVVHMTKAEVSK